jgi:hypothetical protein
VPSEREYPSRLPEPEYKSGLQVRRVRACGRFGWKGQDVFLSESLRNEPIGLEAIDDRCWLVYFAAFPIARFDSYTLSIHPLAVKQNAPRRRRK